jgi:pyruvate,orthophosphate dikinase
MYAFQESTAALEEPAGSDRPVPDGPIVFGAGFAAGLDSSVLGTRGAEMEALVQLGLPIRQGITVPVGGAERLTDEHFAAEAISLVSDGFPAGLSSNLFRLSASAPVAVAGLPPELLCLGLSLDNFEQHAEMLGRPDELSAVWASTIRAVAEHALAVPSAAISGVVLDVVDPIALVQALLDLCGAEGRAPYPSGRAEQLALAARVMFARWASPRAQRARRAQGMAGDLALALHLEDQVIHSWEQIGRGLAVSRDSETGYFSPHGHFHPGLAQSATAESGHALAVLPIGSDEVSAAVRALETASRNAVEVDFEYSPAGVRVVGFQVDRRPTARTTVALSVELAEQGVIDRTAALAAISPDAVSELLHARFRLTGSERLLVRGLPASPGAAIGRVALSSERVVELAETGAPVILVASETTPADLPGMLAAQAIVTSRGGSASHAAVVARGIGRPAVCGAGELNINPATGEVRAAQWSVREGETISVDGWTGAVYAGTIAIRQTEPTPELRTVLGWADDVRRLGVRANADTGQQAEVAISLGAEGIGLCRTEHQFLGDRLPLIQHVLLAGDSDTERTALVALAAAQREDFRTLLHAVGDRPVTVRLLDAPLHEFLPHHAEHASQADAELARSLREENPMMGVRGVRLAVLHEGLYPAQVQALFTAWMDVAAEGVRPQLEVMVPLVSMVEELSFVIALIRREAAAITERTGVTVPYRVGTMVETPRAALLAGRLVEEAQFLSFGTNDLSQLTFGLSRDDVERRLLAPYLEQGLLTASPFVSLDPDGVGELISLAVTRARAARPDVKLGLCGEHGADPSSIALCDQLGLDYVSCSPQRIPIARLAAAHATMGR